MRAFLIATQTAAVLLILVIGYSSSSGEKKTHFAAGAPEENELAAENRWSASWAEKAYMLDWPALTGGYFRLALPFSRGEREAWGGPVYADKVMVHKAERRLELLKRGKPLRSYRIALGANPDGHKLSEGDRRTPEGRYVLDWRNPISKFYKSIHISYPNEKDIINAYEAGVSPGGLIMIHGLSKDNEWAGELHALKDWTDGCIAVTNDEMDEIWAMVKDGTPIEIR